jgi:aspartokinase-like uncharacterized kinase
LRPALRALARAARERRILVLPGGGAFADAVRAARTRHALDEPVAHRMALLAMDQYGVMIASLAPGARAVRSIAAARRAAAAGRLPVLLASALVDRAVRLERSFRLTSDSIAAWLAGRAGAARLVLLKSAGGMPRRLTGPRDARRLARRGLVDPLFAAHLPRGADVWIANGQRKGSIGSAIGASAPATGTVRGARAAARSASRKTRTRAASSRPARPLRHSAPRAPTMSGRSAATAGS